MKDYYKYFVYEAEMFFVNKFITGASIENEYSFCIDVIYKIENNPDVDYTRGIIAHNKHYGQGKSFFFEVLYHMNRRLFKTNIFYKTTAKNLVDIYKQGGEKALNEAIDVKNLYIDDIGDEGEKNAPKVFYHFSDKENVLRYVLLKRYEMWVADKSYRTFGTTNLTIEDIGKVYDGRVADRLMQMVYFREFNFLLEDANGKIPSFRQSKSSRPLTQDEIRNNWRSLRKPVEVEKPDITGYMNSLLKDDRDYLDNMGESNWNMVKEYMLKHDYITEEDLSAITNEEIEAGMQKARLQAREGVRVVLGNALRVAQGNALDERLNNITRKDGISIAENVIVRNRFYEYQTDTNFKFVDKS